MLILASTSPARRRLLERLGLPFAVQAPDVDEAPNPGEAPAARALRLAVAKARRVAGRRPGAWVIGSDQVADCDGRVLDKPEDAATCREQLLSCSARSVQFHTAVALVSPRTAGPETHVDLTIVRFRRLSAEEIARYVEADDPVGCAGGFRCERLGVALFEDIETRDPTALEGLPLIWVAAALREAGFDPLGGGLRNPSD